MGLLRDVIEDSNGYVLRYRLSHSLSPKTWGRIYRHRRQRADRGWSDQDTWNAGEHIAKMTAEMLTHLDTNGSTDWDHWFKMYDVKDYSDLKSVVDDINAYLNFQKSSWADSLDSSEVSEHFTEGEHDNPRWRDKETGKRLTSKQLSARIKRHYIDEMKAYNKAKKAMQFFGRHFASFWD